MKTPSTESHRPVLSEDNACRVMQRVEALIAYVSKACFEGDARLPLVAEDLSKAIASASGRIMGSLNTREEEIQLQCLNDSDVQKLSIELERRIATERGRIAKNCNLTNYFQVN
ncbi:MAG: hypothetical protein K9M03_04815 [Kiritimatiellales bacterium]|nr:hypothetical protein [Kiritimatiellales bacterium]